MNIWRPLIMNIEAEQLAKNAPSGSVEPIVLEDLARSRIVTVSAKLSPEELAALDVARKLCGASRSAFIRAAVVAAVRTLVEVGDMTSLSSYEVELLNKVARESTACLARP